MGCGERQLDRCDIPWPRYPTGCLLADDALFGYLQASAHQPLPRRLSTIYGHLIRPDGLRDLAHRALRFRFHDRRGVPLVDSLAESDVLLEGEYADCLQDFLDAVSQELVKPGMGKYRSYKPGTVLSSGRVQTLDGYIAARVYEWHYTDWLQDRRREKPVDFSAADDAEASGHRLAAAALRQMEQRHEPALETDENGALANLLALRLWQLNRHAPTDTVPAAYGALQLWPQIDWTSSPAAELVAFCTAKWPAALEGLDAEHEQATATWSSVQARLDEQIAERWSSTSERKESLIRRGRYLVKALFCPLTNARANARLGLAADHYKTRERYYDLLDAWTKQGGEDQEIDALLALPLPKRRWIPRKGSRDFDSERDTIDAWLRVEA